jgi:PIN domain
MDPEFDTIASCWRALVPMTNRPLKVFLDANVVIRAGKPPGAPMMPRVTDLVEAGYIKVVTTNLTKMEVAKKHANNDFEIIGGVARKRFRELVEGAVAVKLPTISSEELRTKLFEKYQTSTDAMFENLRTETLSIDGVKPSAVFQSYSRETGLFSGEAKKDQFPDAFVWEALKVIATKSDPLIIVTDDGDFDAGIREHEHITRLKSIPDLFAKVGLTIEAAPDVEVFFEEHKDDVVAVVDDELNQWGLQVSDIEDAEIDESTVSKVTFLNLTTFRAAGDSKDILVVGRLEMNVHVSYNHPDWDSATYDSEDKVRIPHHHVDGEKSVDIEAKFTMTLNVDSKGKPAKIADFSFDDDNFIWVSLMPNDYDFK